MNQGKSTTKKAKGFTDEEQAAMKERAKELKAEARAKNNRAVGESDVLAKIAEMSEPDRVMASRPSTEPYRPRKDSTRSYQGARSVYEMGQSAPCPSRLAALKLSSDRRRAILAQT